jgi:integrase
MKYMGSKRAMLQNGLGTLLEQEIVGAKRFVDLFTGSSAVALHVAQKFGLTLIQEAEMFGKTPMARAKGVRNGLIITLLALHPIRLKNFAGLRIGDTFVNDGQWWLHIRSDDTKSKRVDERQVPKFVTDAVNSYIDVHRAILCRGNIRETALWISSTTGQPLTVKNLGTLVSKITRETLGVDVSPHLFRTADASTAAVYGSKYPHLASALLGHRDARVTEKHYNRAMSLSAGDEYGIIVQFYRQSSSGT